MKDKFLTVIGRGLIYEDLTNTRNFKGLLYHRCISLYSLF